MRAVNWVRRATPFGSLSRRWFAKQAAPGRQTALPPPAAPKKPTLIEEMRARPVLTGTFAGVTAAICTYAAYELWNFPDQSSLLPPRTGPAATKPPPPTYLLSPSDRVNSSKFYALLQRTYTMLPASILLSHLKSSLEPASFEQLNAFYEAHPDALTRHDLKALAGYIEFLRAHNISVVSSSACMQQTDQSSVSLDLLCGLHLCVTGGGAVATAARERCRQSVAAVCAHSFGSLPDSAHRRSPHAPDRSDPLSRVRFCSPFHFCC
jgi:hypothetical protein